MNAASLSLLQKQLILHEGVRLKPYRCTAGKLTIGIGRNLDDVGISQEEALGLLRNDIARALSAVRIELPWFDRLDDIRQRVVVDMAFNLGIDGLLAFKQTLAAVASGDYDRAATEMLNSRWAAQVGERARRLARMMRTGRDEF
ncbi:MAG: glycoside hydrolase family protein [Limnohabitans sp.]